ncbi:MAG: DMT family transporter [Verrucomicrobia bacterium]|nr:DMT family transporter [Verrucomicrobiota bacterium]
MPPHTASRLGFLALLAGATGIALAPIFVRVSETGPVATGFHRVFLALPFLWLWTLAEQRQPAPPPKPSARRDLLLLALAGVLFAADLALWHLSIKLTSVANSTLFANVAPLFVALGARALFGDRIAPVFLVSLALALAGAAMLLGASFQMSPAHLAGDGLAVLAAMFYAGYQLAVSGLRRRFSTAPIMFWSGLACAPAMLLIALLAHEQILAASPRGWFMLGGLALTAQVFGQTLIAYGFKHLPASLASLTLLFQPVMAALFAWLLLGEKIGALQLLGGVVVLSAIALARRRGAQSSSSARS